MNLYEISAELLACVKDGDNIVNVETGEVIDIDRLNALKMERKTKIENIGKWIIDLEAESEACKQRKMQFADRERLAQNKAKQLKQYLTDVLGGHKFKTDDISITFRKSDSVKVKDQSKVPERFLVPHDPTVDKAAVKKELKAGLPVSGCELVTKQNISVK